MAEGAPRVLVADLRVAAPAWAPREGDLEMLRESVPAGWTLRLVRTSTSADGDGGAEPSAEVRAAMPDAEAYAGFGIAESLFAAAPLLRWVHSGTAGVGASLFPAMRERDVVLTNSAGVHAEPIAQHVVGGVLFLLRGFDRAVTLARAGRWDREPFVGAGSTVREMGDCRALVIGAGGIGGLVVRRVAELGAVVSAVRRHPERGAPAGAVRVVGPHAWRALLPDADILVLAAPATAETRALVTARELDRLPSDAIVVNVARGSLLDEGALAERVARGALRGAVLDVFAEEPLPAGSPLWGLPEVLMTPHVAAVSPRGFWAREMALLVENWHRYASGRPLRNVVDKAAGY